VVVIWGGSHDVAKNATKKGPEHMVNFVKENSHTNIVIMEAPQRHNLSTLSCVNNEVKVFNRKLLKIKKAHNNMEILDVDTSRGHFTRHGLHMNGMGKEKMVRKNQRLSKKLLQERQEHRSP
jgi:glutamate formiminotransferase